MRERWSERTIPLGLAAGAFALAFAQRPGLAVTDTKIDLHTTPGRFLGAIASTWGSTGDLGHVQGGQTSGYLLPMGPFYALGHVLGLSAWVVQRLWLGMLLALAAWGVVRLLNALLPGRRGIAQLVAGGLVVLNPFVVIYANRQSVMLLAYAALPWLLLVVHRGLRAPTSWRFPIAFAVLVTASGGGVNGAITFYMLLGPLLLACYEPFTGEVRWADARSLALRAAPLTLLVSLWWLIPAAIQSAYGPDFLHFTEQPGTIWATTSASESLRLMGFWDSYLGYGFAGRAIPAFSDVHSLLFSAPVLLASLLVPALTLTGFVWTRRWRYGPFFLALALIGVVIMIAGFPDGTPLRHGLTFTYNHVASVRVLRTTYKAGALLAVALACLAGAGAGALWERPAARSRGARIGFAALGVALVALSAWPLTSGRAPERQLTWKRIPPAWGAAARAVDRMPPNTRAAVLPGDLFAFYTWGGTSDPILPALSRRPVAERAISPYADLHAADLLWSTDALIQQRRLLPGQLQPLLRLMSIGTVVSGSDDDRARSDAIAPQPAASELSAQGFARPQQAYGPTRRFAAPAGDLTPPATLPQVRVYDVAAPRGLIRVEPAGTPPAVIDGSAGALSELAAFGELSGAQSSLRYAADMTPGAIRQAALAGAPIVISDSNRRRTFVPSTLEQNVGATLPADQTLSADANMLDPFGRGAPVQTVAVIGGAASLSAPLSPQFPQFPEHRPFAAFDGSPETAWLADPHLDPSRWWLEVAFTRPRPVPYVDVLPYGDAGASLTAVTIAGRRYAVHPGWNRLALGLRSAGSLRVTLTGARTPGGGGPAAPGIAELRVPGLSVTEELRPPVDVERALAGVDLRRNRLSLLFERTTGDDPLRRNRVHGPWSTYAIANRDDAEGAMQRAFMLTGPRSFHADAWVNVAVGAPDDALDRFAGYRGPLQATSSSRYQDRPAWRASSALDANRATAWITGFVAGQTPWLALRAPRPLSLRRLRLVPAAGSVGRATLVRVVWGGGAGQRTPPLRVAADGRVALPGAISTRALRIDVLGAAFPPAASAPAGAARPVGIAEIEGVRGISPIRAATSPVLHGACGSAALTVTGRVLRMRVSAPADAFENGSALYAQPCGTEQTLSAGQQHLAVRAGTFAVDELRLDSPAPAPHPADLTAAGFAGRASDPGRAGHGRYDGVKLTVRAPAWLVLGESFNRGWHAWCDGRDLGAPTLLDGYANAWRVGPDCRSARFAFAPNRVALAGYVISIAATLLGLLLAVLEWRRGRTGIAPPRRTAESTAPPSAPTRPAVPVGASRVLTVAVLSGTLSAFVFGYGAGAATAVLVALVVRRGIGSRPLTLAAGTLLVVVVPLLYLLHRGDAGGGDQTGYAAAHMGAHWVTVAALVLLATALTRELACRRAGRLPR